MAKKGDHNLATSADFLITTDNERDVGSGLIGGTVDISACALPTLTWSPTRRPRTHCDRETSIPKCFVGRSVMTAELGEGC